MFSLGWIVILDIMLLSKCNLSYFCLNLFRLDMLILIISMCFCRSLAMLYDSLCGKESPLR